MRNQISHKLYTPVAGLLEISPSGIPIPIVWKRDFFSCPCFPTCLRSCLEFRFFRLRIRIQHGGCGRMLRRWGLHLSSPKTSYPWLLHRYSIQNKWLIQPTAPNVACACAKCQMAFGLSQKVLSFLATDHPLKAALYYCID